MYMTSQKIKKEDGLLEQQRQYQEKEKFILVIHFILH